VPKPSPDKPAARTPWRALPENPFVGLRAFESEESLLFFGRGSQTLELMDRLRQRRLVAVVGSSGCGKSSLIRAGLIPNLKAGFLVHDMDRWKFATMKPGESPLYALAAALTEEEAEGRAGAEALLTKIRDSGMPAVLEYIRASAGGGNFLLLVDQFEEIFRSTKRGATAQQIDDAGDFVSLMLRLAEQEEVPAYVVMSMRTDFLGDCDAFFGLPEALNRSQYLVPRLARQQRREVIEGPIFLYQKGVKPELVDRLLNDAGDRSDQLPVLQHALMRTWQEFLADSDAGGEVAQTHYQACGGIAEALNRHAELAMEGMTARQEKLTERVFRMLTDTDDSGRRVRRPQLLSELTAITGAGVDDILEIIERFRSDNRSFVILSDTEKAGDQRVDISHEALFRQWKRLEKWVELEAQAREDYLHLVQRERLYRKHEDELLRDPALKVAEQWRDREVPTAAWAARYGGDFQATMRYLDASVRQREAERARRRRNRRVLAGSVALVFASLVGYFWLQARNAERDARFRSVLSAEDPLVRALAVSELGYSAIASQPVGSIQRVATAAIPLAVLGERDPQSRNVALAGAWFESGGGQVSTLSVLGVLQRWPAGGQGGPVQAHLKLEGGGRIAAVAVSPDRQWIAAGQEDGPAWVTRSDGSRLSHLAVSNASITALAFSPDGERVLAGYADYTVRLWKRDGTLVRQLGVGSTIHTGPISTVQFDSQGKRVLTASWDGTAIVWSADTGKALATLAGESLTVLEGSTPQIASAAFNPDGNWVICGYKDGLALLWRSEGKGVPVRLEGHKGAVTSVAFSPDGSKVVTGSEDLSARIWNLREDKSGGTGPGAISMTTGLAAILSGHTGAITAVAFNSDGSQLITASEDGTARVWWTESREPRILGKHQDKVQSVAFSPDGKKVASSSDDKTARLWNIDGSASSLVYQASTYVRSVAFSPDGTKVVAGSEDGLFCIWNSRDGGQDFRQEKSDVLSVAFMPGTGDIVTGTRDNRARIWPAVASKDVQEPLLTLDGHTDWVLHASFDTDGSRVVTASADSTARVWTVMPQAKTVVLKGPPLVLEHADRVLNAAFSPDGSSLATASADRRARIWSLKSATPTPVREFLHSDEVWSAAFSPDGKWLLTASADKTAGIWSINASEPHLVLNHPSGVRAAAFQPPGGSYVVTGSEDGVVRLWRIQASDLVAYLGGASTACLTARERVRYLGEPANKAASAYQACEVAHGRPAPKLPAAATK
jgi:WD40 repeat protein